MPSNNNLVVGRGRLFFGRFDPANLPSAPAIADLRYLGSTPGFTLTRDSETLDHWSMEGGQKIKDDSVDTSQTMTGTIQTENINAANLAAWLGGTTTTETQASAASLTQTINAAKRGYAYALGVSQANPEGDLALSSATVTKAGVTVPPAGNYTVDLENGLVEISSSATGIADGDTLVVTYALAAASRTVVVDAGTQVYGTIRYLADNLKGVNRNVVLPYVKMTATGDIAMKGDDWQSMSFNLEALKLNPSTPRIIMPTARTI